MMLSADEVVRFLEAVPSLKTRAALTTGYAAGLRASEAVQGTGHAWQAAPSSALGAEAAGREKWRLSDWSLHRRGES
jgi:hypothetical protein